MRLARFSLNDSPRYAFVQKDETDGKDYLIELDGHPLAGDQVKPTGNRYPVDGDGIRLLSPVIPSKVYGLAKNYEAHAQFMHEAGHSEIAHAPEDMVIFTKPSTGDRPRRSDRVPGLLQGHELRAGSGRGDGPYRQERVR